MGAWVAQSVEHLPLAKVVIPGYWDQDPHCALCSEGTLLLPLPHPLHVNAWAPPLLFLPNKAFSIYLFICFFVYLFIYFEKKSESTHEQKEKETPH